MKFIAYYKTNIAKCNLFLDWMKGLLYKQKLGIYKSKLSKTDKNIEKVMKKLTNSVHLKYFYN